MVGALRQHFAKARGRLFPLPHLLQRFAADVIYGRKIGLMRLRRIEQRQRLSIFHLLLERDSEPVGEGRRKRGLARGRHLAEYALRLGRAVKMAEHLRQSQPRHGLGWVETKNVAIACLGRRIFFPASEPGSEAEMRIRIDRFEAYGFAELGNGVLHSAK